MRRTVEELLEDSTPMSTPDDELDFTGDLDDLDSLLSQSLPGMVQPTLPQQRQMAPLTTPPPIVSDFPDMELPVDIPDLPTPGAPDGGDLSVLDEPMDAPPQDLYNEATPELPDAIDNEIAGVVNQPSDVLGLTMPVPEPEPVIVPSPEPVRQRRSRRSETVTEATNVPDIPVVTPSALSDNEVRTVALDALSANNVPVSETPRVQSLPVFDSQITRVIVHMERAQIQHLESLGELSQRDLYFYNLGRASAFNN